MHRKMSYLSNTVVILSYQRLNSLKSSCKQLDTVIDFSLRDHHVHQGEGHSLGRCCACVKMAARVTKTRPRRSR